MLTFRRSRTAAWLAERFDVGPIVEFARHKTVPMHRRAAWTFLGGVLLFFFVLQVVSGIMLMMYYRPTAAEAHESVTRIVTQVPFGWLLRSVHAWGAHLMIVALFLHFFSTLLMKAYRRPRELTWISGFLLLVMTLALGFSGYLLPWDALAYTATRVGTDVPMALGPPGELVTVFLRGGADVGPETLGRFFAFHTCLFPLLLGLFAALHLGFVQLQGMSIPRGEKEPVPHLPFFPNVVYRDLALWTLLFGVLVTLGSLLPPGLGPKADPLAPTPEGMKPEWYFLFLFQTIKIFPAKLLVVSGETVAVALVMLAIVFFMFVPFFDRRSARGEESRWFTFAGWGAVAYFLALTLWGFLA